MENLNAEQIIKALECCIESECDGCTYDEQTACKEYLLHDALALIKELTEVVERSETARGRKESIDNGFSPSVTELQRENERLRAELAEANKDKQILFDEIASLEAESEKDIDIAEGNIRTEIASGGTSCHWCQEKVRADTVREMQKNLKEYLDTFYNTGEDALLDIPDLIDQIVKEMLEGEK